MCLCWQIYAQSWKTVTDKTTETVTVSILPLRVQESVCDATHEQCEVVSVACVQRVHEFGLHCIIHS
jgi:hypothetical protein